jgi:Ca2+-binding RTX toxin-like protein
MKSKTFVADGAAPESFTPDVLPIHAHTLSAQDVSGFAGPTLDVSADPYAGTTAPNGKEIWTVDEAADNLHRTGTDWTHGNYGALNDGVLTYGFWTYDQFMASYFHELRDTDGTAYNADAYYAETYGLFEAFRADQEAAAGNAISAWDDLINVKFVQAAPGAEADIMFGAVYMSPAAGAHAYYPQAEALDQYYGTTEYGKTSGDVMINWVYNAPDGDPDNPILPRPADDSFSNFSFGSYGNFAITHELGHSLGLSHAGQYNATNGPATYAHDAYFYQDSNQYTIMSYFLGNVTGQSVVNLDTLTYLYAQTPAVHDVYTVQQIYGADMTTRTGDTVYGFNSTADKAVFDFAQNDHPVLTIWDAAGNDTLDLSGFNSNSVIDINEGAFSSASYKVTDAVKAQDWAWLGITSEAQWQSFLAKYAMNPDGSLHDNISIAYGAQIENAIGGSGNDTIIGNDLANRLVGNAGNDTIRSGDGIDVISLGAGNDTFIAELGTKTSSKVGNVSWDIITDFGAGDKIDLSGLDENFHFRGTSANKYEGDVTYKVYNSVNGAENALGIDIDGHDGAAGISGPVTVVFTNVDGGQPDIGLILLNHNGVSAGDFLFA